MKPIFCLIYILQLIISGCASQTQNTSDVKSAEESSIMQEVNSVMKMSAENNECIMSYINNYQAKIFQDCMKSDPRINIGGGCAHVVGYAITDEVLNSALIDCKLEE